MNNSSSKKRVTRQDLKKKSKDKKVKNTRANEEGMKREKKKDREGKKNDVRVGDVKENVEEKAGEYIFNVE